MSMDPQGSQQEPSSETLQGPSPTVQLSATSDSVLRTPQLPSLPQQAKNLSGAIFRAVRALSQGQPVRSPEQTLEARLAVCRDCLDSTPRSADVKHRRCVHCGCFVFAKAKLITEACPRAKW